MEEGCGVKTIIINQSRGHIILLFYSRDECINLLGYLDLHSAVALRRPVPLDPGDRDKGGSVNWAVQPRCGHGRTPWGMDSGGRGE